MKQTYSFGLLQLFGVRRGRQLALFFGLLGAGPTGQGTLARPVSAVGAHSAPAAAAAQVPTDIYLLIGQSNMAGRGEIGPLDEDVLPDVQLYNGYRWVPAENPLNRYSTVRKELNQQQLGPGYTFGRKLAAVTGRRVGLVVNARGGTNIGMWQPGQHLYQEAVKQAREALAEGGTLKGIIWHQGEANSSKPDAYLADFRRLVTGLRADLGADVPVVVGGLAPWVTSFDALTAVLRAIPNHVPNTYYVSSAGLTPLQGDKTNPHFNGLSQRVLGERYADRVLEAVYRRSSGVVAVFTECGYQGYSTNLPVGSYSRQELEKHGIPNNAAAAVKVRAGYKVELFTGDFRSSSITLEKDVSCLRGTAVADQISYIRVSHNYNQNSRAAELTPEAAAQPTARPQLRVSPNPATNELLTVDLYLPREAPAMMQLFDSRGQLMELPAPPLTAGQQRVLLPLAQLPNGVYLLEVRQGAVQVSQRILVAR